jgi:hypothetical protein
LLYLIRSFQDTEVNGNKGLGGVERHDFRAEIRDVEIGSVRGRCSGARESAGCCIQLDFGLRQSLQGNRGEVHIVHIGRSIGGFNC